MTHDHLQIELDELLFFFRKGENKIQSGWVNKKIQIGSKIYYFH